jgi:hypothetical protein
MLFDRTRKLRRKIYWTNKNVPSYMKANEGHVAYITIYRPPSWVWRRYIRKKIIITCGLPLKVVKMDCSSIYDQTVLKPALLTILRVTLLGYEKGIRRDKNHLKNYWHKSTVYFYKGWRHAYYKQQINYRKLRFMLKKENYSLCFLL